MRALLKIQIAAAFVIACGSCSRPMDGREKPDAGAGDPDRRDPEDGAAEPDAAPLASDASFEDTGAAPIDPWAFGPSLGARRTRSGGLEVRVRARSATRLELCLFSSPIGETDRLRVAFERSGELFSIVLSSERLKSAGLEGTLYYGLRAFGPNWPYDPGWAPGSELGFISDVDADGNRMNPNKLLLDPYALEVSHDPVNDRHRDSGLFETGARRAEDSGRFAPKGIVIDLPPPLTVRPSRAFRDEIITEAHLRGLTRVDPTVPEELRGTYAGAVQRARWLRELGVTAIELLPLHETQNDQNELTDDAAGDNYWGYSSLSFFAPDRRFARDKSPGGPTRELRAMVEAFHAEGLKVYADVVYNHTAEGGSRLYSWRGLDNAAYYELAADRTRYVNSNGVGANFNTADPIAADLVIDSLRYWHEIIGVDGFRFDLAAVVGNECSNDCFRFDREGLVARIARELPADLIAEPWGVGPGTYQIGNFPARWAEWNDHFRDTIRRDLNRLDVVAVTPRELIRRFTGSPDLFQDDGRKPWSSVNYVVSHDGFTLNDLFSHNSPDREQVWPCGPSSGGNQDELQWDQRGIPERQRRAARTALALTALSAGVPMITAGDEMLRTQRGNNNPFNIDSTCTWIDWSRLDTHAAFHRFTQRLFAFRNSHAALRPAEYWSANDDDRDGLAQSAWLRDDGQIAGDAYLDDPANHFIALLLDSDELGETTRAIYVGYNGWSDAVIATIPAAPSGTRWHLFGDTGIEAELWDNWHDPSDGPALEAATYTVEPRAVVVLVAR
jgi:isoamylase